jgi:hypothetical protein
MYQHTTPKWKKQCPKSLVARYPGAPEAVGNLTPVLIRRLLDVLQMLIAILCNTSNSLRIRTGVRLPTASGAPGYLATRHPANRTHTLEDNMYDIFLGTAFSTLESYVGTYSAYVLGID